MKTFDWLRANDVVDIIIHNQFDTHTFRDAVFVKRTPFHLVFTVPSKMNPSAHKTIELLIDDRLEVRRASKFENPVTRVPVVGGIIRAVFK